MKREKLLLNLFTWELDSMNEYSSTLPTGRTPGKMWKRAIRDGWQVGMYIPDADPMMIGIVWFNVQLRSGPMPRLYAPPDWNNHGHWRELRS